jgi:hypothetical protein
MLSHGNMSVAHILSFRQLQMDMMKKTLKVLGNTLMTMNVCLDLNKLKTRSKSLNIYQFCQRGIRRMTDNTITKVKRRKDKMWATLMLPYRKLNYTHYVT